MNDYTFCYHSNLSVYGACRLCIVDIEGMGIVTSCSTTPKSGMKLKTHTDELMKMRKIYLELLLAKHHQSCTSCDKSGDCKLQELASRLRVSNVRFKPCPSNEKIDASSHSLVRDPNKCILCGDCVRACSEIQGIGAIDFIKRGCQTTVGPAFNKDLDKVDCVYCGLCASVCPTGAIVPKSQIDLVWNAINDKNKKVVVQIAPAVRVSIGEMFGAQPGTVATGKLTAALKMLGFDKVFDTSFAADLTVLEETNEFIKRKLSGQKLPQFTSCCPAWVKYVEQYYSDLLGNLSSCRSPQQMFGSIAKETLPKELGVDKNDVFVVSIMPCTAKKFEAQRPEFKKDEITDVDAVLTVQELGKMIKQAGIQFNELEPESLDMPLGFKTGAGVIFGTSGGVSEAVLRYASEKLGNVKTDSYEFTEVRGTQNLRTKKMQIGNIELKLAIVYGLKQAGEIAEQVRQGKCDYDFIEVMACPNGCISGAGQPISFEQSVREKRTAGLYETDKMLQLHKSQDNPYLHRCYNQTLGEIGGHKAHQLLHTSYKSRKRYEENGFSISDNQQTKKLNVCICVGTSCYLRGSQKLMQQTAQYISNGGFEADIDLQATFCFEACDKGPTVRIGDKVLHKASFEIVKSNIESQLKELAV